MGLLRSFFLIIFSLLLIPVQSQIISVTPSAAGPDQEIKITYNAALGNGELTGASKVYMHHGVVTDSPTSTEWNYVIGNWGQDDGIGQMTKVNGTSDTWELTFSPTVIDYFNVPDGVPVFRISMVFRSADGNTKGTIAPGSYGWGEVADNLDIYVDINSNNFVSIDAPLEETTFLTEGESVEINGSASGTVSSMQLFIDEGNGYLEKASVNSGTNISYNYFPSETQLISIKIDATISGEVVSFEKDYNIVVVKNSSIAALPNDVEFGINYLDDASKVILALEAPGKNFAFVVGDFNNWKVSDDYQMNKTPDGEAFWLEINGLTPNQEYAFQYWVDERIKIADPYADKILDPWNDKFIESETYPNLLSYNRTEYGIASILETGQDDFNWSIEESEWHRPDVNHLMIYELHIRDFIGAHSYAKLIDSLSYLKELGINAIELMPINEFEGNDSWGYNPSFYFAPDKYYGPKEDLKRLIEKCHEMDMAVILDMVLNHAYNQNSLVQLYFDESTFKVDADNPWFNRDYVGPFEWGFDFNHESDYTKRFIDRVNAYWLEEYHFDGYRFDFTKGFTNSAPGGSLDGFDQSRIDILKRMANQIWNVDSDAYIILEHWTGAQEEQQLANEGMKMWRNKSYDFVPLTVGKNEGNFNGMTDQSHVSFFDSHDERRIAEHVINEGLSKGSYNIRQPEIMYERVKLAAAFAFLQPGPKMMWQFDELGYDIHIDFNGRVGQKPLPWGADGLGYYENPLRRYIYDCYKGILDVRNTITPQALSTATTSHKLTGFTRRLSFNTSGIDLVVIGNFGLETQTIDPKFSETGTWYNYFSGVELEVTNVTDPIELKPGEWHIFTNQKISDGKPNVVAVFQNPVTITPSPFTKSDVITINFDAALASSDGTNGLLNAEKVYMHSGLVVSHPDSTNLENIIGTFQDDGIGLMTKIGDNKWQIVLTIEEYYNLDQDDEAYKIGMYFRDGPNENVGKGFRNSVIYFNIDSEIPFIQISPKSYQADEQITITFNAAKGNRELTNANKVYMHSSVSLLNTGDPANASWNNTIGNWGQDDGIGLMTRGAENPNLWSITLKPKDYYNLSGGDFPYWLAAVFRNANGSAKGTGSPGEIENGFIAANLDFFIKNQFATIIKSKQLLESINVYPNPASKEIFFQNVKEISTISFYNINGQLVKYKEHVLSNVVDISTLPNGFYVFQLKSGDVLYRGKFIKE